MEPLSASEDVDIHHPLVLKILQTAVTLEESQDLCLHPNLEKIIRHLLLQIIFIGRCVELFYINYAYFHDDILEKKYFFNKKKWTMVLKITHVMTHLTHLMF